MRSKSLSPGQGQVTRARALEQLRVRDRFGAVLTASVAVLCVEGAVGAIALSVYGQTQESPALPYPVFGIVLLVVLAPFLAGGAAALGAPLALVVVMPLLVAAASLGRRFSGREAWWWVPVLAAVGTAPPALAVAVLAGTGPLAGAGGWLSAAAAPAIPALTARRLLLPGRPRLSGGVMFGRVVLYGTLAVVAAGTLAGVAQYAGIGYEPPRLGAERVAGTWSDGDGGTLVLTAAGEATATRVRTFDHGDPFEPVAQECTGTGTWAYDAGAGPWSQEVDVSISDCPMSPWAVLGSLDRPKLYVFVGDPDSGDLYILQRRGKAPEAAAHR